MAKGKHEQQVSQASASPDTVKIWHLPMATIFLGVISITIALGVSYLSYVHTLKMDKKTHQYYYLNEARTLSANITATTNQTDKELLNSILYIWEHSENRPADEYLCIVDKNSKLILHTARPESIGNYVGDNAVLEYEGKPTCTLENIVKSGKDYIGRYVSSADQKQIAAFVAVPKRGWTIGIHRSESVFLKELRTDLYPMTIGLLIVCVILILALLSVAVVLLVFFKHISLTRVKENNLHCKESDRLPDEPGKNVLFNRAAIICSTGAIFVAVLGLAGWIPGLSFLGSISPHFIPMAPSTSICFIVFGLIVLIQSLYRMRGWGRYCAVAVTLFLSVFGIIEFAELFTGIDVEDFFLPQAEMLRLMRKARMSPATGTTFFFSGIAMLFVLLRDIKKKQVKRICAGSGIVGSLVIIIALTILLSYLYGNPLLYGGASIPMAATTAVGFVFLGLGLVAAAGPGRIPIRLLVGQSIRAKLLRVFLPLSILTVISQDVLHRFDFESIQVNKALLSTMSLTFFAAISAVVVIGVTEAIGGALDSAQGRRRSAEKKSLAYQGRLQKLLMRLTEAEEKERRRIATELHDRIGQSLVFSKMGVDNLNTNSEPEVLERGIEDISDALGDLIEQTQSLTYDLGCPTLYELGLESALNEWLIDELEGKHNIASTLYFDKQCDDISDDAKILVYRSIRELLVNVIKHARATEVNISVMMNSNTITVNVADNGVGFDLPATSDRGPKGGFGIFSIKERVYYSGGKFDIDSHAGFGTNVTFALPLNKTEVFAGN